MNPIVKRIYNIMLGEDQYNIVFGEVAGRVKIAEIDLSALEIIYEK